MGKMSFTCALCAEKFYDEEEAIEHYNKCPCRGSKELLILLVEEEPEE